MTDVSSAQSTANAALGLDGAALRARTRSRRKWRRGIGLALVWAFVLGNGIAIVYLIMAVVIPEQTTIQPQ